MSVLASVFSAKAWSVHARSRCGKGIGLSHAKARIAQTFKNRQATGPEGPDCFRPLLLVLSFLVLLNLDARLELRLSAFLGPGSPSSFWSVSET